MKAEIRKTAVFVEETHREMGRTVDPPTRKAVAVAVIANPPPAMLPIKGGELMRFDRVITGYVEEAPFLQDVAGDIDGPALCLPLFALSAGHVTGDVPEALEAAGFDGPLLPPIGAVPQVPALIARAVRRQGVSAA